MSAPELDALQSIPDPLEGGAAAPKDGREADEIAARVLGEKSPTRTEVSRSRGVALGLALAWCAIELAVLGVRGDLSELPLGYAIVWVLSPLALAGIATFAAIFTGKSGLGVKTTIAAGLAVLGPLVIAMLAMLLREPNPNGAATDFWRGVSVCLELTLAGAAAPLAFAVLTMRRAFAGNARLRSALLGGAAGLVAAAVMNTHCPNGHSMHMLLGHALPILIATLFGALVGYKLTRS